MNVREFTQTIGGIVETNEITYSDLFNGLAATTAAFIVDLAADNKDEFESRLIIIRDEFILALTKNVLHYKTLTQQGDTNDQQTIQTV